MSLLRKFVPRPALNEVWQQARSGEVPLKCSCPGCANSMKAVTVETESGKLREVDVCTHCQSVWLDAGEWHQLANLKIAETVVPKRDIAAEVRERIAQHRRERVEPPPLKTVTPPPIQKQAVEQSTKVQHSEPAASKPRQAMRRFAPRDREPSRRRPSAELKARESMRRPTEARRRSPNAASEASRRRAQQHEHRRLASEPSTSRPWGQGPTEFWHWLPALLGMPVEDAQLHAHHDDSERPLFTWTLALGILVVSLIAFFDLNEVIAEYGLIPAEYGRMGGLTWLTSFFLHVGPLHLLGNLYFLVVFGDNVEKCFGALEFLLLIIVATVFGSFMHILFDPSSMIPCVGASGGISGVIAFYALRFPKTKLSMMFWFIKPFWFRMSAIWLFGLWVLLQVVIAGQQLAGMSQISGGAHLGGALVGVVAWLLWRIGGGARDLREAREGLI